MIENLRKIVLLIVIASLVLPNFASLPAAHAIGFLTPPMPSPLKSLSGNNALIISSIDAWSPMRDEDLASFNMSLTQAGYTVTYVKDGAVTLDLFTQQLNNYQVIIWRTNAYEHNHNEYWYIGQDDLQPAEAAYQGDFASGSLDGSNGVLGAGVGFFTAHFTPNSLSNVRLLIILSSIGNLIESSFINAGVSSIIDFTDVFSLSFNWYDYITTIMVRFLSQGYSVEDAVNNTIQPLLTMILRDELDSMQIPSASYTGDTGLTIT